MDFRTVSQAEKSDKSHSCFNGGPQIPFLCGFYNRKPLEHQIKGTFKGKRESILSNVFKIIHGKRGKINPRSIREGRESKILSCFLMWSMTLHEISIRSKFTLSKSQIIFMKVRVKMVYIISYS